MALLFLTFNPARSAEFGHDCLGERDIAVQRDMIAPQNFVPSSQCYHAVDQGVSFKSRIFRSSNGRMPVSVVVNESVELKEIVFEIIGGPGQSVWHRRPDEWASMARDANRGVAWVTPSYVGTNQRSVYPESDLPRAIDELGNYLNFLQRNNPGVRITVVGYSTGGFLAALLVKKRPQQAAILLAPAIQSPDKIFHELTKHTTRKREEQWFNIVRSDATGELVRRIVVSRLDFAPIFFGAYYRTGLAELLQNVKPRCTVLVYGILDDRIGTHLIVAFKRIVPSVPVFAIKGDHYLYEANGGVEFLVKYRKMVGNCRLGNLTRETQ